MKCVVRQRTSGVSVSHTISTTPTTASAIHAIGGPRLVADQPCQVGAERDHHRAARTPGRSASSSAGACGSRRARRSSAGRRDRPWANPNYAGRKCTTSPADTPWSTPSAPRTTSVPSASMRCADPEQLDTARELDPDPLPDGRRVLLVLLEHAGLDRVAAVLAPHAFQLGQLDQQPDRQLARGPARRRPRPPATSARGRPGAGCTSSGSFATLRPMPTTTAPRPAVISDEDARALAPRRAEQQVVRPLQRRLDTSRLGDAHQGEAGDQVQPRQPRRVHVRRDGTGRSRRARPAATTRLRPRRPCPALCSSRDQDGAVGRAVDGGLARSAFVDRWSPRRRGPRRDRGVRPAARAALRRRVRCPSHQAIGTGERTCHLRSTNRLLWPGQLHGAVQQCSR